MTHALQIFQFSECLILAWKYFYGVAMDNETCLKILTLIAASPVVALRSGCDEF
jgi:hypothetical protein